MQSCTIRRKICESQEPRISAILELLHEMEVLHLQMRIMGGRGVGRESGDHYASWRCGGRRIHKSFVV